MVCMDNKRCRDCGEVKPLDAFYRHDGCRDGVRPECKTCNLAEKARRHAENPEPARERTRAWHEIPENRERTKANHERYKQDGRKAISNRRSHLKRKYGITLEEYEERLTAQGGVCAICRRPPRPDISLHVDHNHVTGELRGLLCFSCNITVGHVREDADHLASIARYLDVHDGALEARRVVLRARLEQVALTWKQSA
jgi:hypothetical protein